ncbi:hypothetical protein Tco_1137792 [Tanacetum coccineum]
MDTNRRSSKRQQKIPNHFNDFVHDLNKRKESGKSKGNNGKNKNGNECLDQAAKECLDKNISQNGLFEELAECKDSDTQVLMESEEMKGMMMSDAEIGDEVNKGVNVPADKVKFSSVNDEMLANNAGCCNLKLPTDKATGMVDESQTTTRTINVSMGQGSVFGTNDSKNVNEKSSYASIAKNHCLDNKLILIPTKIGNDGAEVVIFDDEIVKEGSKKWEFTVCSYFVGYKMSYQELKYNLFRM